MNLTSNTILITGGGSGIGYELTKQLTALSNTILITGRDQAKMDRVNAAFPKVHTFRSDVSRSESDRHLRTERGNHFETGEFRVCPDESQFPVSMVFAVLQNLTARPQFLLERENPR
jgi:NADPH:quinone reductase-like Zn-dependent oxidoreductase